MFGRVKWKWGQVGNKGVCTELKLKALIMIGLLLDNGVC